MLWPLLIFFQGIELTTKNSDIYRGHGIVCVLGDPFKSSDPFSGGDDPFKGAFGGGKGDVTSAPSGSAFSSHKVNGVKYLYRFSKYLLHVRVPV